MLVRRLLAALLALVGTVPGYTAPVTTLAFSPDGAALVSNGPRRIDVRSSRSGQIERSLSNTLARITSLTFRKDGALLAVAGGVAGQSGEAQIIDWKSQATLARFTNFSDLATCAAFSPDGDLLAVTSADASVKVYRTSRSADALPVFTLDGHSGPVLTGAFDPSGRLLVTAGADRSVKVWSAADGKLIRSFSHHTDTVQTLAFRPTWTTAPDLPPVFCATGGDDRTVRIWQPEIGRMVRIVRGHEGAVLALAFHPNGAQLFSAGTEGGVRRLDADSDAILGQWQAHEDWIYALAVSPDGATLATGDWSGTVRLWDTTKEGKPAEGSAR